jgi:hypothetical protein
MLPSFCSNVILLLLVSLCTVFAWNDCGQSLNSEVPRFTQFALFPNPVKVGQTVHARAVMSLSGVTAGTITDGTIQIVVSFEGESVLSIPGISLCNSSSSIICSTFASGDNPISFNFELPKIATGNYVVTLLVNPLGISKGGCVSFDVTVEDPASSNMFTSWIEATLAGVAQFSIADYEQRQFGDLIQVGPIGPSSSGTYQWGTFMSIIGSQDVLGTSFSPVGYVWGINGNMTSAQITRGLIQQQTYTGRFYLGYVRSLLQKTLDTKLSEGDFTITWTYNYEDAKLTSSILTGTIDFDDDAVLPVGWPAPVSLGRLGLYTLYTNDAGIIMVNSTKKYCLTDEPCDYAGVGAAPMTGNVSDRDVVIAVTIAVGIPLIAVIILASVLWLRHKRRHEDEAGIFSAARKPEYGNALVIDDIIQESREHGSSIMPSLERRPGDTESDDDDDDYSREGDGLRSPPARGRGRRSPRYDSEDDGRSPVVSRSRSRSIGSDDDDSYSD